MTNPPVAVDQFRRQTRLGITATYRVACVDAQHAVVEVVSAPGLPVGMLIRMTLDAVERMELVDVQSELEGGLAQILLPEPV